MKPISSSLQTHMEGEVTSLATCWKLMRRDETVLGFTDHDKNITYESVIYYASSGFTPASISDNAELSVDNLDVEGVLDSNFITEADIQAGLYDYAEIEVFRLNYEDTSQGVLTLRRGWLGEVRFGRGQFTAEVRGLMQSLAQTIGELYSPLCRAKLGDGRCKVSMAAYTVTGTVDSAGSRQVISDSERSEDNGYFDFGTITFTGGENDGLSMEVKRYTEGELILALPMPYDIEAGDTYSLTAGCDKTFTTCVNSFNNAVNFRAEPHMPGIDAILKTAGTI